MARYGMVIDLNICIGCNACTMACKAEHATPPGVFWGKVLEKEVGKYPAARRVFLPVLCNHCKNPACMEAFPYGARTFHHQQATYFGNGRTPFEEAKQDFSEGVVMKCNFCVDRVEQGMDPACVQTCPTECRVFGDLDDPESKVSRLAAEKKARPLLAEKGLEPSVFYIGS